MPLSRLGQLSRALVGLNFTVLPSSICPGFGVYALKKIPKNTYIGQYPGSLISDDADTHMRDLLRQWRTEDSSTDDDKIRILKRYFNISIESTLPQRFRYDKISKMEKSTNTSVNWRRVLIAIYSYSFQTDEGTLVPSRISYSGLPIFNLDVHETQVDNSSLTPLINEAPPGTFKNLLTGRPQRPFYNVDVTIEGDKVIFFTKRSIPAGNELFFFYGPSYTRDYDIHMEPKNCGWGQKDFDNEEDPSSSIDFYEEQKKFHEKEGILSFITTSRRDDMRLNLKQILTKHRANLESVKSS